MAELTAALGQVGHSILGKPPSRPCARCGEPRGRGHKYCSGCRADAMREDRRKYNADYHREHYRRRTPAQVSEARRTAVRKRWRMQTT